MNEEDLKELIVQILTIYLENTKTQIGGKNE